MSDEMRCSPTGFVDTSSSGKIDAGLVAAVVSGSVIFLLLLGGFVVLVGWGIPRNRRLRPPEAGGVSMKQAVYTTMSPSGHNSGNSEMYTLAPAVKNDSRRQSNNSSSAAYGEPRPLHLDRSNESNAIGSGASASGGDKKRTSMAVTD